MTRAQILRSSLFWSEGHWRFSSYGGACRIVPYWKKCTYGICLSIVSALKQIGVVLAAAISDKNNSVATKLETKKRNSKKRLFLYRSLFSASGIVMCTTLEIIHIVVDVVKSLNFISMTALSHYEFIALLKD